MDSYFFFFFFFFVPSNNRHYFSPLSLSLHCRLSRGLDSAKGEQTKATSLINDFLFCFRRIYCLVVKSAQKTNKRYLNLI